MGNFSQVQMYRIFFNDWRDFVSVAKLKLNKF